MSWCETKRLLGLLTLLEAACLGASTGALAESAHTPPSPSAFIDESVNRVLNVLRTTREGSAKRRRRIEEIAFARFHFASICSEVMGRHWGDMKADQQGEFQREFKRYLSHFYGLKIDRYSEEAVTPAKEVRWPGLPPGVVMVRTRVIGGQYDNMPIDYALRKVNESWKIVDVVVEGVSLVRNFGEQFGETWERGEAEGALKAVREKNRSSEEEKLESVDKD